MPLRSSSRKPKMDPPGISAAHISCAGWALLARRKTTSVRAAMGLSFPGWRILLRGRKKAAGGERSADTGTLAVGIGVRHKHSCGTERLRRGRVVGMIVAFSVAPTITNSPDAEMSEAVAEAVRVVRESGLPHETNAMFTLVEGEWDEVFGVIKKATEVVEAVSPRVSLVIKADIRPGYTDRIRGKVDAIDRHLGPDAAQ